MVERPIKKSEQQRAAQADSPETVQKSKPLPTKDRSQGTDKSQGTRKSKDRNRSDDKDRPSAVSPALMRGPRPTPPAAPVIAEPEEPTVEEDAVAEASEVEAEATPETEASPEA